MDIDISKLANDLATYLAPAMPILMKVITTAGKAASDKLGEEAWGLAKSIWGKLRNKVKAKPALQSAAIKVAKSPENKKSLDAFTIQLEKLLSNDKKLTRDLSFLSERISHTPYINQTQVGNYNTQIGRARDVTIKNK